MLRAPRKQGLVRCVGFCSWVKTDSYLNVIAAQTTLLANRQTLTNLRTQQLTAGVQLIEALGGGWNASALTSRR